MHAFTAMISYKGENRNISNLLIYIELITDGGDFKITSWWYIYKEIFPIESCLTLHVNFAALVSYVAIYSRTGMYILPLTEYDKKKLSYRYYPGY